MEYSMHMFCSFNCSHRLPPII